MILLRYRLERVYLEHATPGSWYDPQGVNIAKNLELPWRDNVISNDASKASCIPEGIYLVVWQPPGHGRNYEYFRYVFVPGRHWHPDTRMSSILIHPGNLTEHLLGCQAPGSRHADINGDGIPDVVDSTSKLRWMTKNMPKAFEVEIIRKPGSEQRFGPRVQ